MNTKEFLRNIADLLLISEESTSDWIEDTKLKFSWYIICFLVGIFFLMGFIGILLFEQLSNSSNLTILYRITRISLETLLIISIMTLTYNYYQYILSNSSHIKLLNVIKFYLLSIVIYGLIYSDLFLIQPGNFIYNVKNISDFTTFKIGINPAKLKFDFMIFSAIQSINGNFFKIQPQSIFSSIVGYTQSLYTFSLIALFIASYVNQKTHQRLKT